MIPVRIHWGVAGNELVFYAGGKPIRRLGREAMKEFVAKGAMYGRVVIDNHEISGPAFWRAARDATAILAGEE